MEREPITARIFGFELPTLRERVTLTKEEMSLVKRFYMDRFPEDMGIFKGAETVGDKTVITVDRLDAALMESLI
jgi:hypothetical protein